MNKKTLTLAALILLAPVASVAQMYFIVPHSAAIFRTGYEPHAVYITNDPTSRNFLPPRVWTTVDLKRLDPRFAGVAAVDFEGLLVITGNNNPATLCQIQVQFRHTGATQIGSGNYQWQQIVDGGWSYRAENGGSIRKPVPSIERPFKTVTLYDGTFDVWWANEPSCPSLANVKIVKAYLP